MKRFEWLDRQKMSLNLYRDEKRTESLHVRKLYACLYPVSTYTAMKSGLKVN